MGEPAFLRAFSAGELAPGLGMRADLQTYQQGLRTCRNFLIRPTGGAANRPGFEYIATCKEEAPTFLFAFIYAAADENYLVEAGEFYFRFHHHLRGMVLELAHPYIEDALHPSVPLCWHQSGRVVSLTHPNYPPMELIYQDVDTFVLQLVDVTPAIDPPENLTLITAPLPDPLPDPPPEVHMMRYVVTSVRVDSYEESLPDGVVWVDTAAPGTPSQPVVLTWDAEPLAIEYNIYKDDANSNTFGYLGTATGQLFFHDIGQIPDMALTPPVPRPLFDSEHNYPCLGAFHGQRRIYAGSNNHRDRVWASRVGQPSNFTFRSPLQDDDAITWQTITKDLQVVIHLVSLQRLIMLTDRGEWIVRGDEDGVLTPTTINPLQHGYVGAWWTTPVVYGDRILFVQARGHVVRELAFTAQLEGLSGQDLTVQSAHLFKTRRVMTMAFALVPDAILWCQGDDGELLGCTYLPEQDVLAWHRHHTQDGHFEQVIVLPEGDRDALYAVIERDSVRTIERMGERDHGDGAIYLDSAVRVTGPATRSTLDGLAHLAGRDVRVRVSHDGTRQALPGVYRVAVTGEVTLRAPVTFDYADIGLAIEGELETLDLDLAGSEVRDRRKKVTMLAVQVEDSYRNFLAGPDNDSLQPVQAAPWETGDEPFTGRIELQPTAYFNDVGRVVIRHSQPTPLTVLGILPHVDIGG